VDFSGHGEVKVQVDDMSDPTSYIYEAERLLSLLSPEAEDEARKGRLTMILPGLSVLAGTILAVFHGRFGHFPFLKWKLRDSESGEFGDTKKRIDLQMLRNESRKGRLLL
jgi:hypothetical protein